MAHIVSPYSLGFVPTLDDLPVTREDMMAVARCSDALARMRLSFFCPRCHSHGRPDGVEAHNDPTDAQYTISCGCTKRVYVKPKA